MTTYLILARHGPKDHQSDKLDRNKRLRDGGQEVEVVASVLAETLSVQFQNEDDRIVIGQLWHGSYRVVRETGVILFAALRDYGVDFDPNHIQKKAVLDPECFWKTPNRKDRQKIGQLLLDRLAKLSTPEAAGRPQPNAILVVGHQPQLGWIAETVLGRPVPIGRSEIVCLAINRSRYRLIDWARRRRLRWLLWAISPPDSEAIDQLREKVKSKMQLAGVLGTVITFFLGLLLGWLLDSDTTDNLSGVANVELKVATVLFLSGLALYMATVYAYDRLLMPIRYWGESASPNRRHWLVCRPPSPANWVLYQNMMRAWNWLFTPATGAVMVGLLLLAHAVFAPPPLVSVLVVVLALAFLLLYRFWLRPALGTED